MALTNKFSKPLMFKQDDYPIDDPIQPVDNTEMAEDQNDQFVPQNEDQGPAISTQVRPNGLPNALVGDTTQNQLTDPNVQKLLALSPEYQAKLQEMSQAGKEAIANQQAGIKGNEDYLNKYEAKPAQVDLSPLLGYSDSLYGTKYLQGYKPGETQEQKDEKILALKNAIQAQKGALTDKQLSLLKDQLTGIATPLKQQQQQINAQDRLVQRAIDNAKARTLSRIASDKTLNTRLTTYSTLDNALANMASGKIRTKQGLEDAQQLVIRALGGGGQSGVGERAQRTIDTLDLRSSGLKQLLFSKPEDIMKKAGNRDVAEYIQDLATQEQTNAKDQFARRIAAIGGGNERLFASTPYGQQAAKDIADYIKANQGQFNTPSIPDISKLKQGQSVHIGSSKKPFAPNPGIPPAMSEDVFIQKYIKAKKDNQKVNQ